MKPQPLFTFFTFFSSALGSPVTWDYESNPELGPHFEGDIIVDDAMLEKSGVRSEAARWPSKTLVYRIAPSEFSAQEIQYLKDAMAEIQSKTCIRFREGSSGDYVYISKGSGGCSSNIGRVGGRQQINLASACFRVKHGTAVHEMIHALGFYHEQSRPDRDDYIKIHYAKIQKNMESNFRKETDSIKFSSYDYGSVMHYPRDAFAAKAGDITIEVKTAGAAIGQRRGMSKLDAEKLNKMYNC